MYNELLSRLTISMTTSQKVDFVVDALNYVAEADGEVWAAALNSACKAVPDAWIEEARQFMAEGKKVCAIKVCRAATGWGLKVSKDYCEQHLDNAELFSDWSTE